MKSYDIQGPRSYISIYDEGQVYEIPYEWGLAGPGGAWFVLKPASNTDEKYVAEARNCLRRDRDVVSLRTERQDEKWTKCERCHHFHGPTGYCG